MPGTMKPVFGRYVEAWIRADMEAALETLDEDGVITECDGPVYRGRNKVRLWREKWPGEGNRVPEWDILSRVSGRDADAFEWRLLQMPVARRRIRLRRGRHRAIPERQILYMCEYATTAECYEWYGTWRSQ